MKFRFLSLVLVLAVLVAAMGVASPVQAAAYGTSFVTSITYQNIDAVASQNIVINFYPEGSGTPIQIARPNLAVNAGTSLYVGGLSEIFRCEIGSDAGAITSFRQRGKESPIIEWLFCWRTRSINSYGSKEYVQYK
jgi:hypothetical protein